MRILSLFIIIYFFTTNIFSNTLELDLLKVMKIAYKNNTDIKLARSRLESAIKNSKTAYKKFSLKLDASISAVREDMPSYYLGKTVDARSLNMLTTDLNDPGKNSHYETSIDMFYPIYFKGLRSITRKFADLDKNIAKTKYDAYSNEIISISISLYYNYRITCEQVKTELSSLKRVKKQLSKIEIKYNGGSLLKSDVLGMKVRLQETKMRLIKAKNNRNISRSVLLSFLGLDNSNNIKIIDSDWDLKKLPNTFENALKEAYKNRNELKTSKFMIKKGKQGIKMAKSSKKPEIIAFGKLAYNDNKFTLSNDQDSYMIGLKINYNLWDNNITKYETETAKEKLNESKLYSEKIRSEILLDVRKAFENLNSAYEAVKVSKANINFATENLDIMKNQYEGGTVTISAYLDAELAYSNALLGNVSSKYQLLISKSQFGRALGYCLMCVSNKK